MMAHGELPSPPTQPRRVKVYELKNNDWFDRGTGYCTGSIENEMPQIQVKSEEESDRMLLETRIIREDGYQKQQETLIVWTEPNGTDMALSFQEPEGCAAIWEFVNHVQGMQAPSADEPFSDDADGLLDSIVLPSPDITNVEDIEMAMRQISNNGDGRVMLDKFVLTDGYYLKLMELFDTAEDLEMIKELHHLCGIAKMLITLNDNVLIEAILSDDACFYRFVGMLEYDPDFPTHKANHRQYLKETSKFKEVVPIANIEVKKKIHLIYRLQYLKDVILARMLDDPTFSVLNSMIFFHQVEVIKWVHENHEFVKELFALFVSTEDERKSEAVLFIQQCCQIAKGLQVTTRQALYQSFIHNGLFLSIDYALRSPKLNIRIAGMDIIMAMIDHDPQMLRSLIFKQISEGQKPITDMLIELLQSEHDFGIKAQVSDAIKILLDPQTVPTMEFPAGDRRKNIFYDESAKKLFTPLIEIDKRESLQNLTASEVSLYTHLLEILWFFVRQHVFRSKHFILTEQLPTKIIRLLESPEKHLKLSVVKLMRILVALRDNHFEKYIISKNLFEPIVDVVLQTMPRDNLLNSACLEFFEFIRRENIRNFVCHLGDTALRPKLEKITYVDIFQNILNRCDQWNEPPPPMLPSMGPVPNARGPANMNGRWQGVKDMDPSEEEYFNTSDDDEEGNSLIKEDTNGVVTGPPRPLVDYIDDDDDDAMEGIKSTNHNASSNSTDSVSPDTDSTSPDILQSPPATPKLAHSTTTTNAASTPDLRVDIPTPERLAEKRRRTEEEDDEDELARLASRDAKRRSPSVSSSTPETVRQSVAVVKNQGVKKVGGGLSISVGGIVSNKPLRSPVGGVSADGSPPAKKIAISLGGAAAKAALGSAKEEEEDEEKEEKKEKEPGVKEPVSPVTPTTDADSNSESGVAEHRGCGVKDEMSDDAGSGSNNGGGRSPGGGGVEGVDTTMGGSTGGRTSAEMVTVGSSD